MTPPPILSAKNIHKTFFYPVECPILRGISLDISAGTSLAIMGSSGEGKSTLLHILGTLEAPTTGEIWIAGKEVSKHPSSALRNQHIGFIFQAFHLLDDYTVLQNVLMPALIAGKNTQKSSPAWQRAVALLDQVGLSARRDFPAKLLSGGEKQRVSLARALCNDPELILADEPSGNLDRETSEAIHALLLASVKEYGKALIVVTHDSHLAAMCDQTLLLSSGTLTLQA